MRYCIDIDATICHTTGTDYELAVPIREAIEEVRRLKSLGHYIIFLTARGSGSGVNHEALTKKQLDLWGAPYDELHFGKPFADFYVDDKAISAFHWHDKIGIANSNAKYQEIFDTFLDKTD